MPASVAMTEVFMRNSKQYTDEFEAEAVKQVIERSFMVWPSFDLGVTVYPKA
jgi:hypothetical protein